jgi:hypothetical protein
MGRKVIKSTTCRCNYTKKLNLDPHSTLRIEIYLSEALCGSRFSLVVKHTDTATCILELLLREAFGEGHARAHSMRCRLIVSAMYRDW